MAAAAISRYLSLLEAGTTGRLTAEMTSAVEALIAEQDPLMINASAHLLAVARV
ncbi:hypothetical protein [Nonomuraea insulae]|uniref:Uncharacterized protein n=1 Tax=Nonomuraea insulae TaxID=1616787 RepID=A0ABW1DDE0_9ACTN